MGVSESDSNDNLASWHAIQSMIIDAIKHQFKISHNDVVTVVFYMNTMNCLQ